MLTASTVSEKTIIHSGPDSFSSQLKEVWRFRDLLLLLTLRDISTRFRQSVIGFGWAILRPVISAAIYTLVFSVFVRIETEVPYPVFAFAGLIPWMFFSTTLSSVTASVVSGGSLIKKVYFPRLILPLSSLGVGFVELLLQLLVLMGLMGIFRQTPGWSLLSLPVFIAITIFTAFAAGIWFTSLNVKYRDVGMAIPFLIQIWMYLCPIVYPVEAVPERYQFIYSLNPMVGVVEGFRWSLLGSGSPNWIAISLSAIISAVMLISGLIWFRKVEATFADIV